MREMGEGDFSDAILAETQGFVRLLGDCHLSSESTA